MSSITVVVTNPQQKCRKNQPLVFSQHGVFDSPPPKKKEEKTPGRMGCFCTGLLQLSRCYALWRTHGRRDQGTLPHRKSKLLEPPKATVLSSFSEHLFTMSFHVIPLSFHDFPSFLLKHVTIILPAQGALSPSPSPSATATFSLMVPFAGSDGQTLSFRSPLA